MVLSQDMSSGGSIAPLYLLLLPPAPLPLSRNSLRNAYSKAIAEVLRQLKHETSHATTSARLDVAVPVQYLQDEQGLPRSALYSTTEKLVACIYKMICVSAVKNNVNVEDREGIDVRVLLLAHSPNENRQQISPSASAASSSKAVDSVIDLRILAASRRPWQYVFSVESECGDQILQEFLALQNNHMKIHKVAGSDSIPSTNGEDEDLLKGEAPRRNRHHRSIAVGGTFDHIHIGHKLLLTMFAFLLPASSNVEQGERSLTIGVTGDELLVNKKFAELLEGWDDRQRSVSVFLLAIMDFRPPREADVAIDILNEAGLNGHAVHLRIAPNLIIKCVEISEPFGPTITDEEISALAVSGETRAGGKAVNDKRIEKNWPELEIFEVQVLDADEGPSEREDDTTFQNKLSSTQIRQAIRDRGRARSKV